MYVLELWNNILKNFKLHFQGSALLRLYHLETMEHLQDVSVSSVIGEIIEGMFDMHYSEFGTQGTAIIPHLTS